MDDELPGGFPTENAVWVETTVVEERGRWVVYLEVGFWEPNELDNIQTIRHRIQDYPKKRLAEIAARWIERTASKDLPNPPLVVFQKSFLNKLKLKAYSPSKERKCQGKGLPSSYPSRMNRSCKTL